MHMLAMITGSTQICAGDYAMLFTGINTLQPWGWEALIPGFISPVVVQIGEDNPEYLFVPTIYSSYTKKKKKKMPYPLCHEGP